MKKLRDISLFRILLFSFAVFYFRSLPLFVIFGLFILFDDWKAAVLYALICSAVFLLNSYRIDLFPLGIVETKRNAYVIIDKLFYKVKLFNADDLAVGDVLLFRKPYQINDIDSQISKNLLFAGEGDYDLLFHFFPRSFLRNRLENLSYDSRNLILRFLYNEYPDYLPFDTGHGLTTYFLFKKLKRRSSGINLFLLMLYSVFFAFDIRFYLILMDCILDIIGIGGIRNTFYKCIVISMTNINLFANPSFKLAFLLDLYHTLSMNIGFKAYLIILFSLLFGESDLISILLFETLTFFRISILLSSFAVLLIPKTDLFYLKIVDVLSKANSFSIPIRGSLSITGFIMFFYLCRKWRIKGNFMPILLLIMIIILPIHHPLSHICFIDVGQGDSILIRKPFIPSCVLIDTGSIYNYSKLKNRLSREGIYVIDYLIITHEDSDHSGNLDRLKKDFMVREIVTVGKDIDYGPYYLDHLELREFDNDNDNSLVYLLNAGDLSVLLTGDISVRAERELIRKYGPLSVNVLKVSHHGSKTGTCEEFISEILPDIAIISTSGQYGHPHPETTERLNRYGVEWYTTGRHGTIGIYISRFFVFLATAKNEFVIMRS